VASFLEACPSQVQTWDDSVVKHLVNNPGTLQAFKAGCDTTKWNIIAPSNIAFQNDEKIAHIRPERFPG
jgi:hypothetical protein